MHGPINRTPNSGYTYKVHDGPYLSVTGDGSIIAQGYEIGSMQTFELTKGNDTVSLKAYNGKYFSVAADGTLVASGDSIGNTESFELVDRGYLSEWTILATYNEPFMLTGFTVSESYGSDLGLFYSDDKNETIRANMLLSYDCARAYKIFCHIFWLHNRLSQVYAFEWGESNGRSQILQSNC